MTDSFILLLLSLAAVALLVRPVVLYLHLCRYYHIFAGRSHAIWAKVDHLICHQSCYLRARASFHTVAKWTKHIQLRYSSLIIPGLTRYCAYRLLRMGSIR